MQKKLLLSFREPFNGLSHLSGAVMAVIGQVGLLIVSWNAPVRLVSALIYGLSLISMFSASAIYHLANVGPRVQKILRKLDHSAIFLLIAGTYTPFCMQAFSGFFRWGLLAIVWAIALGGILVKIFWVSAPRWLNALVYVLMGWLCVTAIGQIRTALGPVTLAWLVIGGLAYTFGALIYATKLFNFVPGKFGFHEVWHLFVLLGALAHFIAVSSLIAIPRL